MLESIALALITVWIVGVAYGSTKVYGLLAIAIVLLLARLMTGVQRHSYWD